MRVSVRQLQFAEDSDRSVFLTAEALRESVALVLLCTKASVFDCEHMFAFLWPYIDWSSVLLFGRD